MQAHVAPPFDVCARVAKAVSCIGDGATRCFGHRVYRAEDPRARHMRAVLMWPSKSGSEALSETDWTMRRSAFAMNVCSHV